MANFGLPGLRLSANERSLLGAAVCSEPDSLADWEQWQLGNSLDTAGTHSQALFSMVYANLGNKLDIRDAKVLKGVYKRTWYANQLILTQVPSILERLGKANIPVLLFNDVAMAAGHYPDHGYRAIRCIDLLVRQEAWQRSLEVIAEHGWRLQKDDSFSSPSSLSITLFTRESGQTLRLWTRLFMAIPQTETEADLWRNAISKKIGDRSIMTLGASEQLLAICSEAFRMDHCPLILYSDARLISHLLLTTADWTRLIWQAQRYTFILPLRRMLAILQETLDLSLPSWVLPALHKMAISHSELLQYHLACDSRALKFKSFCLRGLKSINDGDGHGG